MITKPITAARLSEIAALHAQATSMDYSRSIDRQCVAAIPELLAEVERLKSRQCPACEGWTERLHGDGLMYRCTVCGGTGVKP